VKVVATYSIKGGVGKTTTAVNLAFEAARAGVRVLVWDLDPQGAATYLLRIRPKVKGGSKRLVSAHGQLLPHIRGTAISSVHVVPADFSLRHLDLHLDATHKPTARLHELLQPLESRYDLALLDCPPSISLASESTFGATDALLVPVIPTTLARRTLTQLRDFLGLQSDPPRIVPLLTMVDRRRTLHRQIVEELLAQWPGTLHTLVPEAAVVERMGEERAPVAVYAPRSRAALAFRSAWNELAELLWPAD
jgi:cellulose biosynthesis protein BcsQ